MNDYVAYKSLVEGDEFLDPPPVFEVTQERVEKYIHATGDTTAELKEQDEMGRQLAPPMLAAVYVIEALRTRVGPPGGIHAKQHFKFHRPAIVGERLYTTAKILRLFIKRERQYVEMLTESRNQTGELVTTGMITRIWGKGE
tara:strand:- start:1135 stop:1560 length:426 start_codon:yes stop_codon:yes gene_type:complete